MAARFTSTRCTSSPAIRGANDFTTVDITFKNRHMPAFIPARLTNLGAGEYRIDSSEDVQGIAPGQFAVIYDPAAHLCFGSGIITGRELDD